MNKKFFFFLLFLCCFNTLHAQQSVQELVNHAQAEAKANDKAILVKFEASWCGWCHKMTEHINNEAINSFFNENYIVVPIVVMEPDNKKDLENPGSKEYLNRFTGGKSTGIPFWVILDKDLQVLTSSFDSNGENIGCPASPDEVAEFVTKLSSTAKSITEEDKAQIKEVFLLDQYK